jgi:type VI protein secretion system component Hcp
MIVALAMIASSILGGTATPTGTQDGVAVSITGRSGAWYGTYADHQTLVRSFRELPADVPGIRIFEFVTNMEPMIPLAMNAMVTGETLSRVEFSFYRMDSSGRTIEPARLRLADAAISAVSASFGNAPRHGKIVSWTLTLRVPATHVACDDLSAPASSGPPPAAPIPHVDSAGPIYLAHTIHSIEYVVTAAIVDVIPHGSFHDEASIGTLHATALLDSFTLALRASGSQVSFRPLVLFKQRGAATPDFQNAERSGTLLPTLDVVIFGTSPGGLAIPVLRLRLHDARVRGGESRSDLPAPAEKIEAVAHSIEVEDMIRHAMAQATWH